MNGFLIIDKCAGISSYDVIRRLKRLYPFKKIGYIGTLDRNATGILPVALNEGVKLIPFLEDGTKMYRARFLLGVTTDTLDIEGTVQTSVEAPVFEKALLEEELNRFMGRIVQRIPAYSSKKIHRKPMYKLARQGMIVESPEKEVEVFDIALLDYCHPYVDLEVTCSKGTYIRALASDFGARLGCGATLHTLKRTRHGEFTEEVSIDIDNFKTDQDLLKYLVPLEQVIRTARETRVETAFEKFLKHGMPIPLLGSAREWKNGDVAKLLDAKGSLIGIGTVDMLSKTIKVKRLINI